MSLDFYLEEIKPCVVFDANITHNLGVMARAAGIYTCLWRPEEIDITHAHQLIEPLSTGLALLLSEPERFRKLDSQNGWGVYDDFVPFVKKVLQGCIEHPDATVRASR